MTTKLYMDSCCFIEYAKGHFGKQLEAGREAEVDMCRRLLAASRDGAIELHTSAITVGEAIHLGELPPPPDVKEFLHSLLMSGRDGVILIQPTPFILEDARDLSWKNGIGRGVADRVHVASALSAKCEELITFDGVLARRIQQTEIAGCRVVSAGATQLLPDKYRMDGLFGD